MGAAVWAAAVAVLAAVTVWYAAVFAYDVVAVLAAVTVWNAVYADVVVLSAAAVLAAVALPSLTCGVVAACFYVEPGRGSAVELVPVAE